MVQAYHPRKSWQGSGVHELAMLLMIMIDGFIDALEQTYSFLGEIPAAGSPRVREAEVLPALFQGGLGLHPGPLLLRRSPNPP